MEAKKGFYTALGTPLDKDGNVLVDSLKKQIEQQIEAGAAGVLCMGSMGAQQAMTLTECARAAKAASEVAYGRIALFVGIMDNSVSRIRERLASLEGIALDGVVLTTPFYGTDTPANLIRFFKEVADASKWPVYLYDLPGATKQKITYPMVCEMMKHKNIKGIKTGDIVLARQLKLNHPDFTLMFSNIDIFDVANAFELPRVLDGMFSCTPKNAAAFNQCFLAGDFEGAGKHLDKILALRDEFIAAGGIWPCFTIAMNLIGLDGLYGFVFDSDPVEGSVERVTAKMKEIGEI